MVIGMTDGIKGKGFAVALSRYFRNVDRNISANRGVPFFLYIYSTVYRISA